MQLSDQFPCALSSVVRLGVRGELALFSLNLLSRAARLVAHGRSADRQFELARSNCCQRFDYALRATDGQFGVCSKSKARMSI